MQPGMAGGQTADDSCRIPGLVGRLGENNDKSSSRMKILRDWSKSTSLPWKGPELDQGPDAAGEIQGGDRR